MPTPNWFPFYPGAPTETPQFSPSDVVDMRRTVIETFDKDVVGVRPEKVPDELGGETELWVTMYEVRGRLISNAIRLRQDGTRYKAASTAVCILPAEIDVELGDKLVIAPHEWTAVGIPIRKVASTEVAVEKRHG